MNRNLSVIFSVLILSGCATGNRSSLPYDAWRLGFFAPDYMEVWIETSYTIGINGMVRFQTGSGYPAMGYPRAFSNGNPEVYRGSPKGWPERVGWGKGKHVKGADLPKQIYVRWQSLVEPQTYHVRIDIPESTRDIMRKGERAFCGADGKWITGYREAIVIGLAPGGIAKVWVTGPCLSPIEVTRVQAELDPTGPYDGESNGQYDPPSAESRAYIEKFGVPYGSW